MCERVQRKRDRAGGGEAETRALEGWKEGNPGGTGWVSASGRAQRCLGVEWGEGKPNRAVGWTQMTFDVPYKIQIKVKFPPLCWLLDCGF